MSLVSVSAVDVCQECDIHYLAVACEWCVCGCVGVCVDVGVWVCVCLCMGVWVCVCVCSTTYFPSSLPLSLLSSFPPSFSPSQSLLGVRAGGGEGGGGGEEERVGGGEEEDGGRGSGPQ